MYRRNELLTRGTGSSDVTRQKEIATRPGGRRSGNLLRLEHQDRERTGRLGWNSQRQVTEE